jgi:hypothetical protein
VPELLGYVFDGEVGEARNAGEVFVDFGIADVNETIAVESGAEVGQLVLSADEVRGDSGAGPQARLEAERAIGATADDAAMLFSPPNESKAQWPRRLADLDGAIDVEADQGAVVTRGQAQICSSVQLTAIGSDGECG